MTRDPVSSAVQPFFLDGPAGRLFAIHHPPAGRPAGRGSILFLHAFAEEMNRSRRMAALTARAIAGLGHGVLLLDCFGTGDSEGDFADARLEIWRGDVEAAANWLQAVGGGPVGLAGIRFGALLAVDAAARAPGRYAGVILCQPVVSGQQMLTQLLRVRVAAAMGGEAGESTGSLRARLAAGEGIEVAGYELAPELVAAIDAMRLEPMGHDCRTPLRWIEVSAGDEPDLLPASRRIVDGWGDAGVDVSAEAVPGEPFWSLQETTLAPEMIGAALMALAGEGA